MQAIVNYNYCVYLLSLWVIGTISSVVQLVLWFLLELWMIRWI